MITLIPHKNLILFNTIFYSIFDTKSYKNKYPLAVKILKDFKFIKDFSQSKKLQSKNKKGLIDKNIFRYSRLALYTDDNLKPENRLYGHYSYGEPLYNMYLEHLEELFKEIKKDSNFDSYYKTKILPEYKKICSEIQPFFDENDFSKEFNSFWKLSSKPELFVIPNIFSNSGGSGITKPQKYYSLTGAYLNEENNIYEFIPQKIWFNSIHEFCHSAFKDSLVETNNFKNYLEISEEKFKPTKDYIPKEVLQTYNTGYAYFEDTFIRACRIKILENYYKRTDPNLNIDFFVKDSIRKQTNENGFKFVGKFFDMLTSATDIPPADVYIKVLKDLKS